MVNILIVYGTTDGQTAKIANAIAGTLRSVGAVVDVRDAANGVSEQPGGYAAVIVAASVHARGYQRAVGRWVKTHAAALRRRPTAFVSVCLGVLQHEPAVDREIAQIMERFFADTGWTPSLRKVVAGALLYRKYNPLKRWVMRRIVQKAHGDTDTSRDYEYTDWNDLDLFARRFLDRAMLEAALASGTAVKAG